MISVSLKNMSGFSYLTDENGRIISMNEPLLEFFDLQENDITGKFLNDLPLLDGDMLDSKNMYLMRNQIDYDNVYEIFHLTHNDYKNILVQSHKRVLFDHQKKVLGLLNQSFLGEQLEHYNPKNIYKISNTQLHLKLRDNINAIYGFTKQLHKLNKNFTQEFALDSLQAIINKIIITMDGIILENDKYNNINKDYVSHYHCHGIFIKHALNQKLTSQVMSKKINFTCILLDDFINDENIMLKLRERYFALLVGDSYSIKHIAKMPEFTNYFTDTHHNSVIIELIDKDTIPTLKLNVKFLDSKYILDIDNKLFPFWKTCIKNMIRDNIKKSATFIILSIEDDHDSQSALKQLFENSNLPCFVKVETVYSGSEALELAMHTSFDLILVDINLQDMSGFDVAKQIRAIQELHGFIPCPIYGNTGYDYSDKMDYQSYGIDKIYIKPYMFYEIDNILQDFISI